ncbi:MAG: FAD-binding oxidoreductase, partial [Deltaproteobacteria bacterium]|nr:FAD-binding oxidoreductase [Deltaproteobacteria bacterium]
SRFLDGIFESSLLPAAVELLNERACALLAPELAAGFSGGGVGVAVALEGVEEAVGRMGRESKEMGLAAGSQGYFHLEGHAHDRFWEQYSHLGRTLVERFPGLVSVRANFPVSGYSEMFDLAGGLAREKQIAVVILAHAGSGTALIHFVPFQGEEADPDGVVSVVEKLRERCAGMGGNLIVERASSALKEKTAFWGPEPEALVVMKRIKEQMDPDRLFCPGRFVGGI